MRNITLLSDDDKVVRTQITLTENLKKLIEERTVLKNESLSGYLRRAALLLLFLVLLLCCYTRFSLPLFA